MRDPNPTMTATPELRWRRTDTTLVLEQRWMTSDGFEWVRVPVVGEGPTTHEEAVRERCPRAYVRHSAEGWVVLRFSRPPWQSLSIPCRTSHAAWRDAAIRVQTVPRGSRFFETARPATVEEWAVDCNELAWRARKARLLAFKAREAGDVLAAQSFAGQAEDFERRHKAMGHGPSSAQGWHPSTEPTPCARGAVP